MALAIDVAIEADAWRPEAELHVLAQAACAAVLAELGLEAAASEVSLVFTDDASIRRLNGAWRGQDKATNVLSFPLAALAPGDILPAMLGDVILARETVEREAALEGKPFAHHLLHLLVHGLLHLMGYDHEAQEDAEEMERLERKILARLSIPDPYVETVRPERPRG